MAARAALRLACGALAAALCGFPGEPAAAQGYTLTDLGTLGGTNSYATSVNDHVQVAGTSWTHGDRGLHAFLWDRATGMRDLGTLGLNDSRASAVNNNGQVVGYSFEAGYASPPRAFLWDSAGGMRELGTLGGTQSIALGINDVGQVVGVSSTAGDDPWQWHAFLYASVTGTGDLGTLGGTCSQASAINELGQVAGLACLAGNTASHAFLANLGGSPAQAIRDLMGQVDALVAVGALSDARGGGLKAILRAALQQLDRGNATAAVNQLQAFINEVRALVSSGQLTASDG